MRTTENFLKSLPIVASQLGNKLGVKVNLGNVACTDGEAITLPMSVDERFTSREELLGFLVHEASHIRHTSMEATAMLRSMPPIAFELTNAIEDARIEQLITAEYAGASYLLNEAHKPCYEKVLAPDFKTNPQSAFVLYPLYACEATYNASMTPYRDVFRQQCVKHFGEDIMAQVDKELEAYPSLTSTFAVVDLALRLLGILMSALPPDTEQQSQESQDQQQSPSNAESQGRASQGAASQDQSTTDESNAEGSGDGQESGDQNQGSQQSNSHSETDQQSDSETENSEKDSDQTSDQNQANGFSSSSASKEEKAKERQAKRIGKAIARVLGPRMKIDQSLNPGEALKAKLNKDALENGVSDASREFCPLEVRTPVTCSELLKSHRVSKAIPLLGEQRLQIAKTQSVKARKALTSMVQAKARTSFYIANSGHRVSARCLHRVAVGNTRIFERRDEVVGINTSVSLLLDLSASVSGAEETVITAGLAMIEGLRGIQGVKAQMGVFPACATQYISSNAGALNIVVPFGEDPRKYLKEIGVLSPHGGTPLAEALVQNVIQLTSRPENRHIIIVVTDGYVSSDSQLIIKKLLKSGITVVGIGVGDMSSDSFDSLFPIWEVLPFDDLPEALMKISRRLMLEGFQSH